MGNESKYLCETLDSGWISSLGKYIDKFEEEFADYCGAKYAISVANGTVGLQLALETLNIGNEDEVIIPDLTFVATANAVVHVGARPVIADVDDWTYCINPVEIEKKITSKTKAIIPVHLYGVPAKMDEICKIANKNNLMVIEDCAEAHGASINSIKVGNFGDFGVFSFYGNKIITTGEGGMLTTNNEDLYERAKFLRDHAMSKQRRYWHTEIGFNFRMTNMQAAIGCAQLEQIDSFLAYRDWILERYRKNLDSKIVKCNPVVNTRSVNWLVCMEVSGIEKFNRDELIENLKGKKIDTRPFFYPISSLPMYFDSEMSKNKANNISKKGINLPTFVGLKAEEIDYICDEILNSLRAF